MSYIVYTKICFFFLYAYNKTYQHFGPNPRCLAECDRLAFECTSYLRCSGGPKECSELHRALSDEDVKEEK